MPSRIFADMHALAAPGISLASEASVNEFDKMQQIPEAPCCCSATEWHPILLLIAAAFETRDFDDAQFAPGRYHR